MAFKFFWMSICLMAASAIVSCSTLQNTSLALKITPDLADTLCPTWFTPALKNDSVWCECNIDRVQQGLVLRCPSESKSICVQNCTHHEHYSTDALNVSILTGFCMTHNFEMQQTLLALCPYNTHKANTSDYFITLPSNISELNDFMCGGVKREGDLCDRCINNRGPSIRNSGVKCLELSQSGLKWFFFLLFEAIPPTIFFLVILFCKVRATAGPLNVFIFFCRVLSCILNLQTSPIRDALGLYSGSEWKSTFRGSKNRVD